MWKVDKIKYIDRINNEEVLNTVKQQKTIFAIIRVELKV